MKEVQAERLGLAALMKSELHLGDEHGMYACTLGTSRCHRGNLLQGLVLAKRSLFQPCYLRLEFQQKWFNGNRTAGCNVKGL